MGRLEVEWQTSYYHLSMTIFSSRTFPCVGRKYTTNKDDEQLRRMNNNNKERIMYHLFPYLANIYAHISYDGAQ